MGYEQLLRNLRKMEENKKQWIKLQEYIETTLIKKWKVGEDVAHDATIEIADSIYPQCSKKEPPINPDDYLRDITEGEKHPNETFFEKEPTIEPQYIKETQNDLALSNELVLNKAKQLKGKLKKGHNK